MLRSSLEAEGTVLEEEGNTYNLVIIHNRLESVSNSDHRGILSELSAKCPLNSLVRCIIYANIKSDAQI